MQKRNSIFLFASLIALVILCTGLFIANHNGTKPDINKDLFKLVNTEEIDHVTLRSPIQTIDLKFEANQWRVNDKWDADTRMIKVLFATLKQVEPRRPVASSIRDSVKQLLEQKGTHVTLSSAGIKKQSFVSGGNSLKTDTWFLKEGDSQPYTMIIPGYRVYVGGILELDESGWRNKRVFDFNWRNFKSLTSSYPKDPKQGFEIEMKNKYFGIKDIEADTAKLNSYLDAVSLLFATRFIAAGQPSIDSLMTTPPSVKIEIKDIANRSFVLELFTPRRKDAEIYGRLGDGQIVVLEKNSIAEIVRRKEYFISKPVR